MMDKEVGGGKSEIPKTKTRIEILTIHNFLKKKLASNVIPYLAEKV
jgi:hypothetical protein